MCQIRGCRFECIGLSCLRVCFCEPVCMRERERERGSEREAWMESEREGIFESDKLKSHDVLQLGAEKRR